MLSEEGEETGRGARRGFHKVPTGSVEAGDLKNVYDVVNVGFREVEGDNGAREIGVTVVVVLGSGEDC